MCAIETMKPSANFHNATFAAVILAALGPGPALAQRGVEFGYKDRIFEQKYLLPDGLNAFEVQNYLLMSGLRAMATTGGNGFDRRVLEAAGGTCAGLFVGSQTLPDRTPAQTAIDRTPESQETQSPEELVRRPASNDELCSAQMRLFQVAFTDSMSMDHQLAGLAKSMRTRFAGEWVSPSELADPRMQRAAFSVHSIMTKLYRLAAHGIEVPTDASGGTFEDAAGAIASIRRLLLAAKSHPVGLDRYDARLSAAEEAAAVTLAEQAARKEAEEKKAREERQHELERERVSERMNSEWMIAARNRDNQKHQIETKLRDAKIQVDTLERDIQITKRDLEHDKVGTPEYRYQQSRFNIQRSDLAKARDRLATALAEMAKFNGDISPQTNAAGASISPPPSAQPQTALAAPTPTAMPSSNASGSLAVAEDCQQGRVCRVIEITLFCRTPQQMAAILSQRPGPARRQMLTAFTASGDCRKVGPGGTLAWTAPIARIQPQGEAEAELVPGTLADGSAGFMLKDGVIAPTVSAAR